MNPTHHHTGDPRELYALTVPKRGQWHQLHDTISHTMQSDSITPKAKLKLDLREAFCTQRHRAILVEAIAATRLA